MYFNLEARHFETPTVGSAMSRRDQVLWSLFAHIAFVLLVVVFPRLPFVQEAADRRAERLREITEAAELQANLLEQDLAYQDDRRPFIFVQPRIELEPPVSPSDNAVLSDRDRVAQSPLRTLDPENQLPSAEGNSPEFVIADDELKEESDLVAPVELEGDEIESNSQEPADDVRRADASLGAADTIETLSPLSDEPGIVSEIESPDGLAFADSSLTEIGSGPGDPDPTDAPRIDLTPDGLLGKAVENLRQRVQRETFRNYSGDTGRFGPDIQFDTKGVEFGPWIRRFVAQIRRNWFVPYAIWSMHGNVVVTFNVHKDGSLTDLTVVKPSNVEAFTNSAFNALLASNPTQPLPPEYPDDQAFFTVTFYFNEQPPA